MLEQWTMIRKARKALEDGALEEAYRLTLDPRIRDHFRAGTIRSRALEALLERARRHRDRSNLSAAFEDLRIVLSAGERLEEAVAMEREVREALGRRSEARQMATEAIRQAEREADVGRLREARARLQALESPDPGVEALRRRIETRLAEAEVHVADAARCIDRGEYLEAERSLARAAELDPRREDLALLRARCNEARRRRVVEDIRRKLAAGDAAGAWRDAQEEGGADRDGLSDPVVREARRAVIEKGMAEARRLLDDGTVDELEELLAGLPASESERPERIRIERAAALWGRGVGYLEAGEFDMAAELLEEALEASPVAGRIEGDLSRARRSAERTEEALRAAVQGLARGDRAGAAGVIEKAREEMPVDRFVAALRDGMEQGVAGRLPSLDAIREARNGGRLEEAMRGCAALLTTGSHRDEAGRILEGIEERRRTARKELVAAERALLGARGNRGALEGCLRSVEESLGSDGGCGIARELEEAVKREITVLDRIEWGEAHQRRGEWDEALRWYREGLDLSPDHPICRERAAAAARALGDRIAEAMEEDFRTGRWSEARERAATLVGLEGASSEARRRASELRDRLVAAEREAERLEQEASRLVQEGCTGEARGVLDRLDAVFPGHPSVRDLRERADRFDSVREEIESVESGLSDRDAEPVGGLLDRVAALPEDLPRVRELRDRVRRELEFRSRFVIRVEEGSDYLVLIGDRVRIGNILGEDLDLSIMANVSSRHAEIVRSRSFHGGWRYELQALPGRDCRVNGNAVDHAVLSDGNRIGLGENLEMTFRLPTSKSRTALLILAEGIEVDGIGRVLLMAPTGRDGRILLAPGEEGHVRADRAPKPIEIYRATQGPHAGHLVCRSHSGVKVDGQGGRAEERLYPGCRVECGACSFLIDAR
jgi:tetratricopeptide (TPR) repeat protein